MQLTRCPTCHVRVDLESCIQDAAGRELLGLVARLPDTLCLPLVAYLSLFRSERRDLPNERALRLATDVLALCADQMPLAAALAETVQAMRVKQDEGGFKPLANHRYLERVLESVSARPATALVANNSSSRVKPVSKTAQAIELLKTYPTPADVPDWFTRTVCGSLAELMLMSLEGVPAHDTLGLVAARWLNELWPKRAWQQENRFTGARRLHAAIIAAAEHAKRWPAVRDVLDRVPSA